MEKNGLESSLYISNATPFLFLSPLFSPFPTLEGPLFQVRASIITLRNDDEESRVTRQAYLICSTRFKCRGRANISMFVFDGLA